MWNVMTALTLKECWSPFQFFRYNATTSVTRKMLLSWGYYKDLTTIFMHRNIKTIFLECTNQYSIVSFSHMTLKLHLIMNRLFLPKTTVEWVLRHSVLLLLGQNCFSQKHFCKNIFKFWQRKFLITRRYWSNMDT